MASRSAQRFRTLLAIGAAAFFAAGGVSVAALVWSGVWNVHPDAVSSTCSDVDAASRQWADSTPDPLVYSAASTPVSLNYRNALERIERRASGDAADALSQMIRQTPNDANLMLRDDFHPTLFKYQLAGFTLQSICGRAGVTTQFGSPAPESADTMKFGQGTSAPTRPTRARRRSLLTPSRPLRTVVVSRCRAGGGGRSDLGWER